MRGARLKPVVKPTTEELKKQEEIKKTEETLGLDSKHLTEDSSLDFYEKAELNEIKNEFSEFEKEEMSKEILSLRNEIESLKEENSNLKKMIEEEKAKHIEIKENNSIEKNTTFNREIENLKELNSRLETEISKKLEIIRTQQSTIDSFRQVYTRSNYNTDRTVRGTNINGYQEWR